MSRAPHILGLVIEGPSDARTVPGFTDRVLADKLPALAKKLGRIRTYRGLEASAPFLSWGAVGHQRAPRRHGHFGGEPAIEDAHTAWVALQCFVGQEPQPAAVLLVRDSDGKQDERLLGLKQARQDRAWPFKVLLGVAHSMRECWVLTGFIPETKQETASLAALRKELGFDPTTRSERLEASNEAAKKSPKRVLKRLTGGDQHREAQCWMNPALEHLRKQGAKNGLAAFLGEVEEHLAPILAGRID
jgi:hypothetical protein